MSILFLTKAWLFELGSGVTKEKTIPDVKNLEYIHTYMFVCVYTYSLLAQHIPS